MTSRAAVLSLRLTDFRNHGALDIETGGATVALAGPNGAGKTNILEAVSLLTPGRGLRRALSLGLLALRVPPSLVARLHA